jgi:hypothetical protein
MDALGRRQWVTVLFVGAVYLVVGLVFATLAGQATSPELRATWRFAAWVISGVAFAAHIAYHQIRLGSTPRKSALHASLAAGLGAFGLAVAANVHAQATSAHRASLTLALVLWPVLTALPAFLVALAAATGLAMARRARQHD